MRTKQCFTSSNSSSWCLELTLRLKPCPKVLQLRMRLAELRNVDLVSLIVEPFDTSSMMRWLILKIRYVTIACMYLEFADASSGLEDHRAP